MKFDPLQVSASWRAVGEGATCSNNSNTINNNNSTNNNSISTVMTTARDVVVMVVGEVGVEVGMAGDHSLYHNNLFPRTIT